MTGHIGIPLASGGLGLNATDGTSALPLAVLGLCLAWHGYLVYTGKVPVQPVRRGGFLYRPDIDLSALWCGIGLTLWGIGWPLSIPPFLPIDILGQIIAWAGAAVFLFGIVAYIYLPVYLYLPERLRPAWARLSPGHQSTGQPTADQPDLPAADPAEAD